MESETDRSQRGSSRNPSYILPKDAPEGERLDLQHRIFQAALQDFAIPLGDGVANILDVGCGTGTWGEEMARELPGARVVNVDIDPAVRTGRAPESTPNCHFVQINVLQGLPFPDDLFDLTHQRMMSGSIQPPAWPGVVGELIRVTRPGGWIELLEIGKTVRNAGPVTTKLMDWLYGAFERQGMNSTYMERLGDLAAEAGLRGSRCRNLDLPLGSWDPHIGVLMEKNFLTLFASLEPMLRQAFGIAGADYASALLAAPAEWANNRVTLRYVLVQGRV